MNKVEIFTIKYLHLTIWLCLTLKYNACLWWPRAANCYFNNIFKKIEGYFKKSLITIQFYFKRKLIRFKTYFTWPSAANGQIFVLCAKRCASSGTLIWHIFSIYLV